MLYRRLMHRPMKTMGALAPERFNKRHARPKMTRGRFIQSGRRRIAMVTQYSPCLVLCDTSCETETDRRFMTRRLVFLNLTHEIPTPHDLSLERKADVNSCVLVQEDGDELYTELAPQYAMTVVSDIIHRQGKALKL